MGGLGVGRRAVVVGKGGGGVVLAEVGLVYEMMHVGIDSELELMLDGPYAV